MPESVSQLEEPGSVIGGQHRAILIERCINNRRSG
jgi:hypothetical protein